VNKLFDTKYECENIFKDLVNNVGESYNSRILIAIGLFDFIEHLNRRYLAKEVESTITDSGFSKYRRLTRGYDHDWDEIIKLNPHIDPYIYGEGELRYWIEG